MTNSQQLPGNPYVDDKNYPSNIHDLANALLAVAYEQRTANLIAYIEMFGGGIHEVGNRLGLGGNNDQ